jgi:hypothetical protein
LTTTVTSNDRQIRRRDGGIKSLTALPARPTHFIAGAADDRTRLFPASELAFTCLLSGGSKVIVVGPIADLIRLTAGKVEYYKGRFNRSFTYTAIIPDGVVTRL